MNSVTEDILSYFGCSEWDEGETLAHYGKGHLDGGHSGRYPWGSGDDPYQSSTERRTDFLDHLKTLRKNLVLLQPSIELKKPYVRTNED